MTFMKQEEHDILAEYDDTLATQTIYLEKIAAWVDCGLFLEGGVHPSPQSPYGFTIDIKTVKADGGPHAYDAFNVDHKAISLLVEDGVLTTEDITTLRDHAAHFNNLNNRVNDLDNHDASRRMVNTVFDMLHEAVVGMNATLRARGVDSAVSWVFPATSNNYRAALRVKLVDEKGFLGYDGVALTVDPTRDPKYLDVQGCNPERARDTRAHVDGVVEFLIHTMVDAQRRNPTAQPVARSIHPISVDVPQI